MDARHYDPMLDTEHAWALLRHGRWPGADADAMFEGATGSAGGSEEGLDAVGNRVEALFCGALDAGATGITITAPGGERAAECALRIGGRQVDWGAPPASFHAAFRDRLAITALEHLGGKRDFLHGRFAVSVPGRGTARCRFSTLPLASGGEQITVDVTAVGGPDSKIMGLDYLYPAEESPVADRVRAMIGGSDGGLMLVAGKTGAGKTTTLRAIAAELVAAGRRVFIIEDSADQIVGGAVQIDLGARLDCADALRAVERAGPDAVIIDEICDSMIAAMAVRVAHRGAMVVAGVHAGSARMGAHRLAGLLVDYEQARTDAADVYVGVLAQRLLGRPCADHAEPPGTCPGCPGNGWAGQVAVGEVLPASVLAPEDLFSGLRSWPARQASKDMGRHALALIAAGKTTEDEAARVVPYFEQVKQADGEELG